MLDFWGVLIQLASCLSIFDLGGGNSNIFGMFILILGEDSHFDEHIFQTGWNHQLVIHFWTKVIWRWLQSSWTPQNRPTNRKYDHYCHPKVIPLSMCFSWEHVPLRKNTHTHTHPSLDLLSLTANNLEVWRLPSQPQMDVIHIYLFKA